MKQSGDFNLKSVGMLLRVVAVVTSSAVTVLSTWLPLVFGYSFSIVHLLFLLVLLLSGAFIIHGLLTHIYNDIMDFESGTDNHSPALLSGGSRVIQTGTMSIETLKRTGFILNILLLAACAVLISVRQYELAVLILIGIWGALSYSSRPFMLSYKPFLGEWLSLFPSLLALGLAAPWIMLTTIPLWGYQNSIINALWCMAWVMVHHIPDIEADRQAVPKKRTSVVVSAERWGKRAAGVPASLYLVLILILSVWIILTRPVAGIGVLGIVLYGLYLVVTVNPEDVQAVTGMEKKLLLLAMITAIWLGIFPGL